VENEFFVCECNSDEHTLRFMLDPGSSKPGDYADLGTSVFLWEWRWPKRLWIALKYLFGYKCRYGHWDCFTLRLEDAERLRALVDRFIELRRAQE